MKKSPIFPRDEDGDCKESSYDIQLEFSKFLEEARRHEGEEIFAVSDYRPFEYAAEQMTEDRKKKMSWKNSIFSWFRSHYQKTTSQKQKFKATSCFNESNAMYSKRKAVSGPIFCNGGGNKIAALNRKVRQSASGPLAYCFTPSRAQEVDQLYMQIEHQNNQISNKHFGPIYLVT